MCSVVLLQGTGRAGARRGGGGGGGGGGGAAGDAVAAEEAEAADEAEEGGGEDDGDGEREGGGGRYTPLAEPVVIASAYRDGPAAVSSSPFLWEVPRWSVMARRPHHGEQREPRWLALRRRTARRADSA